MVKSLYHNLLNMKSDVLHPFYFAAIFFILFTLSQVSAQKPELVLPIGHTNAVTSVCFSPDGRYTLSASWDNTLRLWDVKTGKELQTFEGHESCVTSACFSPDGRYALSASWDHNIILWDVKTGKQIRSFKGHTSVVTSVCFSPDGRYALSASWDQNIILWDVQTGKQIRSFKGHSKKVESVCFSPDGRFALSASDDATLILWDVQTGKEIRSFEGHKDFVTSACFSPDGRFALSASFDATLILWDVQTGKEIRSFKGHNFVVTSVCFSSNGRFALSTSWDNTIKLWDVYTGKEIRSFAGHTFLVNSACFSPGDRYILSAGIYLILWDVQTGKEIRSYEGHASSVTSACFSPDGRYVLSASDVKILKLWDLQAGKEIRSFKGHNDQVISASFSSDVQYALSASKDAIIKLWDVQTGRELRSLKEYTASLDVASFSSDGRFVLTESIGYYLRLWDMQIGKDIYIFKGHTDKITSACFSSDGRYALSASWDRTIKLWDVQTGEEIRTFQGYTGDVNSVCFSPDGLYALTAGEDNTLKLWDVRTGKKIRSLKGHTAEINTVCFSPDGFYALSASDDYTLKLWDVQNGKEIRSFTGHSSRVNSGCFSPDGRYALSASGDNTLKLWDVQTGKEVAALINIDSTDWIVTTPSGLFDASPSAMKLMYFVAGMEIIEFEQLKDRYWQPGLLPILLGYSKEPPREVPAFDYVKLYPEKQLTLNEDELKIHLTNIGSGIGKVSVFLDDIELINDARNSIADSGKAQLDIKVDLSQFADRLYYNHLNIIKVIAWNAEGYISSRPDTIHYYPRLKDSKGIELVVPPETSTERPAFWAVTVGTSDYSGSAIDLRFAAKDAADFTQALQLGAWRLFGKDSTHISLLTTDVSDRLPHKNTVRVAFDELKKARPKDVVVIYFSGHGVNAGGQDGDFYYMTMDASAVDASHLNDPYFGNYTISSAELTDWINAIPARKKVLILDACSSGQAAEDIMLAMNTQKDVPGSQIRALDRMKDRTGFYILAGSAANQVSYETSLYGQGVLTYALLRGMKGECLRIDGAEEYIDIKKLFEYAEDQVPKLAENIGGIQKPFSRGIEDRGSFDIGRMTKEDKEKIIISEPKPVFVHSDVTPGDILYKDLKLDKIIDGKLMDITSKGKSAAMVFSQGEYPGAYFIRGRYATQGENIIVDYVLVRYTQEGEEIIGNKLKSTGSLNDLNFLAEEILKNIEGLISK